ncbi:MAG: hypothetical protein Q9P01_00075 [Anaerolineae bacterium]|nr:hypothetical protein [Anaerolineae bacterium]
MTSAYVAIAVNSREELSPVVEAIKQVLKFYNVSPSSLLTAIHCHPQTIAR